MIKASYITMGIGAVGVLVVLVSNQADNTPTRSHPSNPTQSSNPKMPTVSATSSVSIQNRDDELVDRAEPAPDLKALEIDPTPFWGDTKDPALIQILATFRPNQIGAINQLGTNRIELELEDGRRFAAVVIGEHRSKADDGTVALDAITTPDGFPIKSIDAKEGGITTTGDLSEVWVIDPSGKAERLSPSHIHATRPVISPDGLQVAFTAQYLIGGSLHPKVLMIKDRRTGELSSYAERKYGADYEIAPVDWVEGGKVLRVIDDWGETGGHMKLKQVRVQ